MLKSKLLPHQGQTLKFALERKYILDASSMGVGKSLSALAVIDTIKKPTLVVCPAFLVQNWINEVTKHTDLKWSTSFKFIEGVDVYLISYTQLAKVEELFQKCSVIVADECHYLKSLDAKRTQIFHSNFYKYVPEYFIAMTGTPLKNRIPEIYSLLLLWSKGPIQPKVIDKYKSYYTFCCRFTNVIQGKYGMSYSGMKNVEELRTYLKPHTIKHSADVLNLPELSETSIVVSYKDDPELLKCFEQFTSGQATANITAKVSSSIAKAKFTGDYVNEAIESDRGPVIVFSDHKKPLEILALELSKHRVKSITGDVAISKRQEIVDQFNKGQLDALLCTYGAASTGINLTASNLMVLNDLPWEVASLEQAKKRSHRLGQSRPCQIVHVIGSSVDELILRSLKAKSKVIGAVLN